MYVYNHFLLLGVCSVSICQQYTIFGTGPNLFGGRLYPPTLNMNGQIWGYFAKLPRGRTHGVTPSYLYLFPGRRRMYLVYRPHSPYLEALISKVALCVCMSVCHINYKLLQNWGISYLAIFGPQNCAKIKLGTDGTCGPSVLALPLGPMVHEVRISYFTFRTNSTCSSVSFGPNPEG